MISNDSHATFEEYEKCLSDFSYFCKKCIVARGPRFVMYNYHEQLSKIFQEDRLVILKKFRNGGFTTLGTAYMLWLAIKGERCHIACRTHERAVRAMDLARNMYECLPEWIKTDTLIRKTSIEINDSKGSLSCSGVHSLLEGRLLCGDVFMFEEAAFIPNMNQVWACVYPAISVGGRCIVMSSVSSDKTSDWFEKMFVSEIFKPIVIDYTQHPHKSRYDALRSQMGERYFRQEMLCEIPWIGAT